MNIKPIWLKYALYYFGISFLLGMIPYYIGSLPFWLSLIVSLAVTYFLGKMMTDEIKAEQNSPYMTYGEVFKPLFLMLTVGTLFYSWTNAVWMNFIDTGVKEVIVEQAKEMTEWIAGMFGASTEMDEALAKVEDDTYAKLEFSSSLLSSLLSPVGAAIMAAIFALFYRKDEPIGSNKIL